MGGKPLPNLQKRVGTSRQGRQGSLGPPKHDQFVRAARARPRRAVRLQHAACRTSGRDAALTPLGRSDMLRPIAPDP